MSELVRAVFAYGATEGKTQWKRLGRKRNRSLERGEVGVRPHGLHFPKGVSSYPFAYTVTLPVTADDQEDASLAAKADAMLLEELPGHSLID
jgi:hypothetical protein